MRKCPQCGGKRFISYAHVVQEWLIDECRLCVDVRDDCVFVTRGPEDKDIWTCFNCGYEAAGKEFYIEDELIEE